MAYASGTITLNVTSTNSITGRITYSESNRNVANNTTDITVSLIYDKATTSYETLGYAYERNFYLTINGTTYNDPKEQPLSFTKAACSRTVLTKTVTITHDANGSKTIAISGGGYLANTQGLSASSVPSPGYVNVTLDTIPRKSTITCTNCNIGSNTTVTITAAATSFYHKVTFSYGSWSSTPDQTYKKQGGTYSSPIAAALGSQIPSAMSCTVTATCYTYTEQALTNLVGSSTTTFTASIPTDATGKPTAVITTTKTGTQGDSGQILKGLTTVKLKCPGVGKMGATITSIKWSGGSTATTAEITAGTSSVGSTTYTCTVTDSRNQTNSASTTVTVISPVSSISGNNTGTMGSAYSLSITRLNSSFTHIVVYAINSSYTSGNRTGIGTSDSTHSRQVGVIIFRAQLLRRAQ